jgi:hypothetical protein
MRFWLLTDSESDAEANDLGHELYYSEEDSAQEDEPQGARSSRVSPTWEPPQGT